MEAFSKIVEDLTQEKLLREQFATLHLKKGLYA